MRVALFCILGIVSYAGPVTVRNDDNQCCEQLKIVGNQGPRPMISNNFHNLGNVAICDYIKTFDNGYFGYQCTEDESSNPEVNQWIYPLSLVFNESQERWMLMRNMDVDEAHTYLIYTLDLYCMVIMYMGGKTLWTFTNTIIIMNSMKFMKCIKPFIWTMENAR